MVLVLQVPAGHHLPHSQIKSYWNMADSHFSCIMPVRFQIVAATFFLVCSSFGLHSGNGNGVIDFPEFCQFYLLLAPNSKTCHRPNASPTAGRCTVWAEEDLPHEGRGELPAERHVPDDSERLSEATDLCNVWCRLRNFQKQREVSYFGIETKNI